MTLPDLRLHEFDWLLARFCRENPASVLKKQKTRRKAGFSVRSDPAYFRCAATSLVMSNIETWPLPPNTALSFSSALIMRLLIAS